MRLDFDVLQLATLRQEALDADAFNADPRMYGFVNTTPPSATPSDDPSWDDFACDVSELSELSDFHDSSEYESLPPAQAQSAAGRKRKRAPQRSIRRSGIRASSSTRASPSTSAPPFASPTPSNLRPPEVSYSYDSGSTGAYFTTATPLNAPDRPIVSPSRQAVRNHRRREQKRQKDSALRASQRTETLQAGAALTAAGLPLTSTGWMGRRFDTNPAALLRKAHAAGESIWNFISGMRPIPYVGKATRILDSSGRLVIYRSEITPDVLRLLPKFLEQARNFVKQCTPMSQAAMDGNKRGAHWFCIAGVDRNNKAVPQYSQWHQDNQSVLEEHFKREPPFLQ